MTDFARSLLDALSTERSEDFKRKQSILSMGEYLNATRAHPERHFRDASKYITDVVEYFGSSVEEFPTQDRARYSLFDAAFAEGQGRVVGHEKVQGTLVDLLKNFAKAGRADRLILLHGPNGSAKTSLIRALTQAAEHYSKLPEGALYAFGWVFPVSKVKRGSLGFGGGASQVVGSYAHLEGDAIEARIPCEVRDHPLLLLSVKERRTLFSTLVEEGVFESLDAVPEVLLNGDLSAKNRAVFDALLQHYQGDVREVLRHVQVERFYYSRRYRKGIVAVEPQMSVDAHVQQITADRTLQSLPASLQHLALFQAGGALPGANRGVLEFNDLLKRPLETWKYLLVATEQSQASVDPISLFLDVVMLASSNDIHLNAFKQHPDWASFKGRFEMVTVPYLLRVTDERAIYEDQIPKALPGVHIAPFALDVAARFAVLTRLEAPDSERYDERARPLVKDLSPEEKLELYDSGKVPQRLSQKERKDLRRITAELYSEFDNRVNYEGGRGASVREIRGLLVKAAQDPRFDHLSPEAVLHQLDEIVRDASMYAFVQREGEKGYGDALAAAKSVRDYYLKELDEIVRSAVGLVDEESHAAQFSRYLKHVSAWTKKVKLDDPLTGVNGDADEDLMTEIEKTLMADDEKAGDFRRSLIAQVGAYRLENPDEDVDYELLFGAYTRRLKEKFYRDRKAIVDHVQENFLRVQAGDAKGLDEKELKHVADLKKNLLERGFNESSSLKAVAFLLSQGA